MHGEPAWSSIYFSEILYCCRVHMELLAGSRQELESHSPLMLVVVTQLKSMEILPLILTVHLDPRFIYTHDYKLLPLLVHVLIHLECTPFWKKFSLFSKY